MKGFDMFEAATPSDLPEFLFGHAQDKEAGTGCSVVIAPQGATGGVSVSGGGPATRETDLLRPENMIESIHAITLAGGSAFGLEASCGVMDALAERSIGFSLGSVFVPIVCGACIFDLMLGCNSHPDKAMGRAAVEAAFSHAPFTEGNEGAGTGASVGKLLGPEKAMKAGFGMQFFRQGDLVVGALVVLNAVGNIINPAGGWLAGCRDENNRIIDSVEAFELASQTKVPGKDQVPLPTNTTLGIIVSNGNLTKAQANKVSAMVNDAYARAIKPVHTSQDGDAIFTLTSGKVETTPDLVAVIAAEAMESAIHRAIFCATEAYGLPAFTSFQKQL